MGRAVVRLAAGAGFEVAVAVGAGDEGKDAGELAGIGPIGVRIQREASFEDVAVCIDFSAARGLEAAAIACAKARCALVSGTTGLDENAKAALDDASKLVPVLWEPNMSIGVHVLAQLVKQAARALEGYDVEVTEVHHRAKVDAPQAGLVQYVGPVKGWGVILILRLAGGYHLVLAGLDRANVVVGQSVAAGAPVGWMPDGRQGPPELYLEVRERGEPVDPGRWLKMVTGDKTGGAPKL